MSVANDWGDSDIAVVGMAGRFPGANDIHTFWQNLCDGVEAIYVPSDQELVARGVDAATLRDPHYVKAAAVMHGVERFDAAFFGYTPREAELMDPQHRLFLECAWETIEHAGYDPERYSGAIGVFGGGTTNTYLLYNLMSNRELLSAFDPMQIDVSNAPDFVATRVSYKLNLRGPSCTVQTACSTSLLAIHMACQSLLNEECDMALAGGVSVHVKHPEGYWYQDGGNVSPDGHCRAFDAEGAGTIFGSGVAAVLLKRLPDALADGDHIHAVVKASALNNDGAGKVGFTAPSVEGQAAVISEALALADVPAESIRYVETHGTATKLGDPIEIRALTKAFRRETQASQFCALGSVKTNLGHLASAAGVTSFIKTVLMLEHGLIPPSLHFTRPNPDIDFATSPFYVNTSLQPWPPGDEPRRAGVSSFGVGGTNAHVVLQQAPPPRPSSPARPWQLLLLSAKTEAALETLSDTWASYLHAQPQLNLADAAYTLQVGRQGFSQRRLVLATTPGDGATAIASRDGQRVFSGVSEMQDRPVVFLFPGMGDQYEGMALELYQHEPTFRHWVDQCATFLQPLLGQDIRNVLYPHGTAPRASASASPNGQTDLRAMLRRNQNITSRAAEPISRTALAHPVLFTVEYALAQLWMEWGVQPKAMLGYSIGEYVAACLAGVFSLEDGLTLVARRAQLAQELPPGAMLAVLLPEAELRPRLNEQLSLAAVNTSSACVVSGHPEAVAALEQQLLAQGVACQPIQTNHAFHSTMMRPLEQPLEALLKQIRLHPPRIPFFSNVSGTWMAATEATDPAYWARHLCQTVRFADCVQVLLAQPEQVLLEMGPGQTMTALARQHPACTPGHVVLASLRQPHQPQSDMAQLLGTLGRLWIAGVTIDWSGFYRHERRQRLALPTYPFERQRYWIEEKTETSVAVPSVTASAHAERKAELTDWFYRPAWQQAPLPPPARASALAAAPWLVFADDNGLGVALAQALRGHGASVVQVRRAAQFAHVDNDLYTLDPQQRDGYTALFAELNQRAQPPSRIVHCMSLHDGPAAGNDLAHVQATQRDGLYSLAYLAQALEDYAPDVPLQLSVVSNGSVQVESSDTLHPARATMLSACRTIPQEHPRISCRYLDVALAPVAQRDSQAARLLAELHTDVAETLVAYRGKQRWLPQFVPLHLAAEAEPAYPLREAGVYIIYEGLVGVGYALAQLLASTLGARLLLLEQAEFPAPAQWATWRASHPADDPVSRKLERVAALQAQGAQLLVLHAASDNLPQLQAALQQGRSHFGALHGAIHTLGSIGGDSFTPLQELDETASASQLLPIIQNLNVFAAALAGQQLDFCMLTSSLSAVLGGLGQTLHGAASCYMDALA
ncbi:MAG: acyltransferase domain-containing protein, partial [Chloroflexaceae bacterium]|nr:acyltransferase domain-containing protein [Chloroflexaceae bacterium]